MKKHLMKMLTVLLILSVTYNCLLYFEANKPRLYSNSVPSFYNIDSETSVSVGGYLKWNDSSLEPKNTRQYFFIKVTKAECLVLDIWDRDRSGIVPSWISLLNGYESCKVEKLESNLALVRYKDGLFSLTPSGVVFSSINPSETGGARLIDYFKF